MNPFSQLPASALSDNILFLSDDDNTLSHFLQTLSCLDGVSEMYPFFYRPSGVGLQDQWGLSSPEKHYSQMRELVSNISTPCIS